MAGKKKAAGSTAKPLPETLNRFGRRYKKEACSNTKSAAEAKTEKLRAEGFTAMTVEDKAKKKFCTFKGKKAATAMTGTKKRKSKAKSKKR